MSQSREVKEVVSISVQVSDCLKLTANVSPNHSFMCAFSKYRLITA